MNENWNLCSSQIPPELNPFWILLKLLSIYITSFDSHQDLLIIFILERRNGDLGRLRVLPGCPGERKSLCSLHCSNVAQFSQNQKWANYGWLAHSTLLPVSGRLPLKKRFYIFKWLKENQRILFHDT